MSKSNIDYKNKVEFSTEDVLQLFKIIKEESCEQ